MFDLVFRNSTKNRRFSRAFFERILTTAGKSLKLEKATYEISINLVGEQRIRSLNKQYRNKDKATDVLSFPLGAEDLAGYNKKALGDLFLCVSFAERAAQDEGMELDTKLAWMTVHGLLHLFGYDHERSPRDEQIMAALEKKILRSIAR
jgi:rRNA maturation RNase YbeY